LNNPNSYGGKFYIFLQIFGPKFHQTVHFGLPKYLDRISNVLQNLKSTKTKHKCFQTIKVKTKKQKKKEENKIKSGSH
jgi:hypothetical protein